MTLTDSSTEAVTTERAPGDSRTRRILQQGRGYGVLAVFIALFLALSLSSSAFLTKINLLNILDQWAPVGIIACAATLVLISGGFDLSVAAVFSLAGVIAANLALVMAVPTALLLGVLAGLALGPAVPAAVGITAAGLCVGIMVLHRRPGHPDDGGVTQHH